MTITNWRNENMLDHQDRTISREELEKRAYELYLKRYRRRPKHG
jgi:hypothetical protein